MKKIICAIMTAMIMCLSVPMTAFAESYPVGDINSNGVTDSNDLREMIVAYAKIMISTNKGGTYEEWNKIAKIDKETFQEQLTKMVLFGLSVVMFTTYLVVQKFLFLMNKRLKLVIN